MYGIAPGFKFFFKKQKLCIVKQLFAISDNSPPGQFAPDNSPPIFGRLAPNLQTTRPQYENLCVTLGKYIHVLHVFC